MRPIFNDVSQDGIASKPFILPQEDPDFYDTYIKTYNVPEFIRDPVDVNPRAWARTALEDVVTKAKLDPKLKIDELRPGKKEQGSESSDLYRQARR